MDYYYPSYEDRYGPCPAPFLRPGVFGEKPLRAAGARDSPASVSMYGSSVEYGLHCLLWLVAPRDPVSSRDLAELQGVPPALLAKIMPRLEKAGIVRSSGGIGGGYALAKPAESISVLDVIDAVEGGKKLFDCKEVRQRCVLFGGQPPIWAHSGVCGIHAVMLRAEKRMRADLAKTSLMDLANGFNPPAEFGEGVGAWLDARLAGREENRIAAVRKGRARQEPAG